MKKDYLEPELEIEKISFGNIILTPSGDGSEIESSVITGGESSSDGANPDGEW